MAAVQHEPVAEKVVQFLPAPPPPPTSSLLPSTAHLPFLLASSLQTWCFFFFLFPPPLQPANKSLALLPFFSNPHCLFTLYLMNTLTFAFNSRFLLLFVELCVPPSPPSLLACLPSSPVSSCPRADDRVLESLVSSSTSGQGSRGVHGSSLSLSPLLVSSHGDEGAALWAVEEVRGNPGSTHSAAVCLFGVVQLHPRLSFSLSLRVAFSCHLSPSLSLIPLSACFSYTLSQALSFYFLFLLVLFFLSHLFSFSSSSSKSRDKVRQSFYLLTKRHLCQLACLFGQLFFPLFSSTVFRLVLPGCPLFLAAVCVVSSRLRQAEQ